MTLPTPSCSPAQHPDRCQAQCSKAPQPSGFDVVQPPSHEVHGIPDRLMHLHHARHGPRQRHPRHPHPRAHREDGPPRRVPRTLRHPDQRHQVEGDGVGERQGDEEGHEEAVAELLEDGDEVELTGGGLDGEEGAAGGGGEPGHGVGEAEADLECNDTRNPQRDGLKVDILVVCDPPGYAKCQVDRETCEEGHKAEPDSHAEAFLQPLVRVPERLEDGFDAVRCHMEGEG
mmetsp:Transcript_8823/g.21822  ORF Transcript_8823/g.21822 Transcript_8823/m.21822 type:complete len:230 (-) Transcript_8823:294-983(-)